MFCFWISSCLICGVLYLLEISFILVCARMCAHLSDRKKREGKGGFLWVGCDRFFFFLFLGVGSGEEGVPRGWILT